MSTLADVHGPGAHAWLTLCGQDRANVRHWSNDPTKVTCKACKTDPAPAVAEPDTRAGHYPGCLRSPGHSGPCEPNALTPAVAEGTDVEALTEALEEYVDTFEGERQEGAASVAAFVKIALRSLAQRTTSRGGE